jgi:hypothetical protein
VAITEIKYCPSKRSHQGSSLLNSCHRLMQKTKQIRLTEVTETNGVTLVREWAIISSCGPDRSIQKWSCAGQTCKEIIVEYLSLLPFLLIRETYYL